MVYMRLYSKLAFTLASLLVISLYLSAGLEPQVMNTPPLQSRPLTPGSYWTDPVSRKETLTAQH